MTPMTVINWTIPAVLLLAAVTYADGPTLPFIEEFPPDRWKHAGPEGWTLESTTEIPGLQWHRSGPDGPSGLNFHGRAVPSYVVGRDVAYAEHPMGAQPFRLRCKVRITRASFGGRLASFFPGVSIGLSSAKPGEMTDRDITVLTSLHYPGVGAGVRSGETWQLEGAEKRNGLWPGKDLDGVGNFADRWKSNLVGKFSSYAVPWPRDVEDRLHEVELDLRITRDANSLLTFAVFQVGRNEPWWQGSWQMPEDLAAVPLRYVVVHRVPAKREHVAREHATFELAGRITSIQAAPLEQVPRIASCTPVDTVVAEGAEIRLTGSGFAGGTEVTVNGKSVSDVKVLGPTELTFRAPDLPEGKLYTVAVRNGDGLTDAVYAVLPYGRMLRSVRPFEALPGGGDVVTVLGAGFGKDVEVLFGDKPGKIVEHSPTRLRVEAPRHEPGPVELVVRDGGEAFGEPLRFGFAPHPYIHFKNADELAALRKKFNDPRFKHYRADILAAAENHLESKFTATNPGGAAGPISALTWGYVLSGDRKYLDRLKEWIRFFANKDMGENVIGDFSFMIVSAMAAAYDMTYADLDAEHRADAADYLSRCLDIYLIRARRRDWFLSNLSNTNAVSNCGGALAALALRYTHPGSEEALKRAKELVQVYANKCILADGGCVEGQLYWNYGLSYYLTMAGTLHDATGDASLLDHPHMKNNVHFVETMLTAEGEMLRFNDVQRGAQGMLVASALGSRHDQPLMLWLADWLAEHDSDRAYYVPYAFLWRGEQPTPEFPGLPTLSVLKDLNWGSMRSDANLCPALIVGVKGNEGQLSHHAQHDLGSFVLHLRGDRILVDRGYNAKSPEEHSLPLIDGQGPGKTGSRIVDAREKDGWRIMTVDSTEAYGQHARRVRRHLVMHGADTLIVLDDLLPAEGAPGKITTQFQTDSQVAVTGRSAVIGKSPALRLKAFGPDGALTERKKPHALVGEYTAAEDDPLVAVIQVADSAESAARLPDATCRRDGDAITVTLPGGQSIRFTREKTGWQLVELPLSLRTTQ